MDQSIIASAMRPEGVDRRVDSLLQAVGRCIEVTGLDGVTFEDVTAETGVSRATLYRRFGSRDGMLRAFLARSAVNTIEIGRRIAGGPGELSDRLEAVLTHIVHGVNSTPWIKREHIEGFSSTTMTLLKSTANRVADQVIAPMLEEAKATGGWLNPAPLDELIKWLVAQLFLLIRMQATDEAEVRRHIRTYIIPVLNLGSTSRSVSDLAERVASIEAELTNLSRLLNSHLRAYQFKDAHSS